MVITHLSIICLETGRELNLLEEMLSFTRTLLSNRFVRRDLLIKQRDDISKVSGASASCYTTSVDVFIVGP